MEGGDRHERRRRAAEAGHSGEEHAARALLDDGDPDVRATALGALARMASLQAGDVRVGLSDAAPAVRRRACGLAVPFVKIDLVPLLRDPDAGVVDAASFALGERGPEAAAAVPVLALVATGHDDALCREAAVAALGAIGDPRGLPSILAAAGDRPAVRRRAIIALAPFDGPDVDAALERALADRDWQVRQAAEDLMGAGAPSDEAAEE